MADLRTSHDRRRVPRGGRREDDVGGYVWLRDRSPVPIAAGEGECGRESFRQLIDRRALDVYQVDISRNGFTDADYVRARVEERVKEPESVWGEDTIQLLQIFRPIFFG